MTSVETLCAESYLAEPYAKLALKRYVPEQEWNPSALASTLAFEVKDPAFVGALIELLADPAAFRPERFRSFALSVLLDYLRKTHELYSDVWLPKLEMTIAGLKHSHPGHAMVDVLDHFYRNYQNELLEHIELEERRLFPYAERLYDGHVDFSYSVEAFLQQHDHALEDSLSDLVALIHEDFPSLAGSFAFRSFTVLLQQFQLDLSVHHLIEEEVFVPNVKNLQRRIC